MKYGTWGQRVLFFQRRGIHPKTSLAGKWDNVRHQLWHLLRGDYGLYCMSKLKDIAIELRVIFLSSASFVYQVSEPPDQTSDESP